MKKVISKLSLFAFCISFVALFASNTSNAEAQSNYRCDGIKNHCVTYQEVLYVGKFILGKKPTLEISN